MKSDIKSLEPVNIPIPDKLDRVIITDFDLDKVWSYNPIGMLYKKLLGYKGNFKASLKKSEPKAVQLNDDVERIKKIIKESYVPIMKPKAVYQFIRCNSIEDDVIMNTDYGDQKFYFPRQKNSPYLSLSDYISNAHADYIGIFVVTAGLEAAKYAKMWEEEGRFKDSFILQSLAITTAESLAEYIHHEMRESWGIETNIHRRKYQGKRYSFGYASCPDMSDQEIIWKILKPEEIGVTITEESWMMFPEASVSAVVFHHPEASYFDI